MQSFAFLSLVALALLVVPALGAALGDRQEGLKKEVGSLRRIFPNQQVRTWCTLAEALWPVLEEEPLRPSVIILAATPEGAETSNRLAGHVAQFARKIFKTDQKAESISGGLYESPNSGPELYNKILSVLESERVVIVEEFQEVSHTGALVVLKLSDPGSAPVKSSVLILTMSLEMDKVETRNAKELVSSALMKAWGRSVRSAIMEKILSVLTLHSIVVHPEESIKTESQDAIDTAAVNVLASLKSMREMNDVGVQFMDPDAVQGGRGSTMMKSTADQPLGNETAMQLVVRTDDRGYVYVPEKDGREDEMVTAEPMRRTEPQETPEDRDDVDEEDEENVDSIIRQKRTALIKDQKHLEGDMPIRESQRSSLTTKVYHKVSSWLSKEQQRNDTGKLTNGTSTEAKNPLQVPSNAKSVRNKNYSTHSQAISEPKTLNMMQWAKFRACLKDMTSKLVNKTDLGGDTTMTTTGNFSLDNQSAVCTQKVLNRTKTDNFLATTLKTAMAKRAGRSFRKPRWMTPAEWVEDPSKRNSGGERIQSEQTRLKMFVLKVHPLLFAYRNTKCPVAYVRAAKFNQKPSNDEREAKALGEIPVECDNWFPRMKTRRKFRKAQR